MALQGTRSRGSDSLDVAGAQAALGTAPGHSFHAQWAPTAASAQARAAVCPPRDCASASPHSEARDAACAQVDGHI